MEPFLNPNDQRNALSTQCYPLPPNKLQPLRRNLIQKVKNAKLPPRLLQPPPHERLASKENNATPARQELLQVVHKLLVPFVAVGKKGTTEADDVAATHLKNGLNLLHNQLSALVTTQRDHNTQAQWEIASV